MDSSMSGQVNVFFCDSFLKCCCRVLCEGIWLAFDWKWYGSGTLFLTACRWNNLMVSFWWSGINRTELALVSALIICYRIMLSCAAAHRWNAPTSQEIPEVDKWYHYHVLASQKSPIGFWIKACAWLYIDFHLLDLTGNVIRCLHHYLLFSPTLIIKLRPFGLLIWIVP